METLNIRPNYSISAKYTDTYLAMVALWDYCTDGLKTDNMPSDNYRVLRFFADFCLTSTEEDFDFFLPRIGNLILWAIPGNKEYLDKYVILNCLGAHINNTILANYGRERNINNEN